jgi:hypothetical protein
MKVRSALSGDALPPARLGDIETMLREYARGEGVTLKEAFDEALRLVRNFEDQDQGQVAFNE